MRAGPLIAHSAAFRAVLDQADAFAPLSDPVLILGETGAGKERVAERIHEKAGGATERPFVAVNCAALAHSLDLAELFGHVKGAFTGATEDRPGLIRQAAGGTLFLDEVGDLPPRAQAALLRALDGKPFRALGGTEAHQLAARVLAATNLDLPALIKAGRFRRELLARLGGLRVRVPPLRERPDDIVPLAELELKRRMRDGDGVDPNLALGSRARAALRAHSWPDNVREVKAVVATAVAYATTVVDPDLDAIVVEVLAERCSNEHPGRSDGSIGDESTADKARAAAAEDTLREALDREPESIQADILVALRAGEPAAKRGERLSIAGLARLIDRDRELVRRKLDPLLEAKLVRKGGRGRGGWVRLVRREAD